MWSPLNNSAGDLKDGIRKYFISLPSIFKLRCKK
jgi:hypothetical protein